MRQWGRRRSPPRRGDSPPRGRGGSRTPPPDDIDGTPAEPGSRSGPQSDAWAQPSRAASVGPRPWGIRPAPSAPVSTSRPPSPEPPRLETAPSTSVSDVGAPGSQLHRNGLGPTPAAGTPVPTVPGADRPATKEVYERLVQVGEGTYGKVYKARDVENGNLVAMKRIRMEAEKDGFPVTSIREIKLLQGLRHPNIVALIEMVVSKGHVYMVFEYLDHDLAGVLHHPSITFSEAHIKSIMWQLLSGLAYMHEHSVLHRDLKGSNILLNKRGELKIADFGLARRYERGKETGREGKGRGRDYTNRVITLWYKPPELLLGATVYGEEVDIWSAGAIFLELFTRRPVFQAQDEIEQLVNTFKITGTPTAETWPSAPLLPWYELVKPKTPLPNRMREVFFDGDGAGGGPVKKEGAMELAEELLSLDPAKRPSARQALSAAYFTTEAPAMEMPIEPLSSVKGEWHELESKKARKARREAQQP